MTILYDDPGVQGDTFSINVINELQDTSMDVVTSIVSISALVDTQLFMSMYSIGMASTSTRPIQLMVLPS
jgi:hypothetical protein